MKKKVVFSAMLSLTLASTAMTAWASSSKNQNITSTTESEVNQSVGTTDTTGGVITPEMTVAPFHFVPNGDATVANNFVVPKDYGHIKIYAKNYSSSAVTVSLTHLNSPGGYKYWSKSIPAGGTLDWRSYDAGITQGMRSGNYTLQWSGGTVKVNGEVWGLCASDPKDFK